jgi:hypothetical protein
MPGSSRAIRAASLQLTLVLAAVTSSARAADVGVSISIGQPGYYGQINIGDAPEPPQLIYAKPVVIERDPHYAGPALYLRVPVGYEKHWEKHCREYNACGRPVYFVRDEWYRNRFVPHYQHRDDRRGREADRPHERDEHRDRDHRE